MSGRCFCQDTIVVASGAGNQDVAIDDDSKDQNEGLEREQDRLGRMNRIRDAFKPEAAGVKKEILRSHNERAGIEAVGIEEIRLDWSKAEAISADSVELPFHIEFKASATPWLAGKNGLLPVVKGVVEIEVQQNEFETINVVTWTVRFD